MLMYLNSASAVCNVCQTNQAACINSTSFYLCFGDDVPNMNTLYHCKNGFDCTDSTAICKQTSSQQRPSCGDTSLCGMCSAHRNYLFACLSRTTFQMCYGAIRPTGQIGYCPKGSVCQGASDAICVLENPANKLTCDIVDDGGASTSTPLPSTTTANSETTTKPTTEILTPTEVCNKTNAVGLFPTVPTDPYCKRYIFCSIKNGILQGIEYNCPSGTYYHIQQKQCVFKKPTRCL